MRIDCLFLFSPQNHDASFLKNKLNAEKRREEVLQSLSAAPLYAFFLCGYAVILCPIK
jgi:hypothetical protein